MNDTYLSKRRFLHHCAGCAAGLGLAGSGAWAREGVEVGKESAFAKLVPATEVEQSALQQYRQMLQQASSKNALGPDNHPQVVRLREIARRMGLSAAYLSDVELGRRPATAKVVQGYGL